MLAFTPTAMRIATLTLRRRSLLLFCAALALVISRASPAQEKEGYPKKTGVSDPGVQHAMTELKPDAEFAVSGHPDWMAVTDDAVWVTSSSANHVVRLDAKSNAPGVIITLLKPCSGLAIGFGSLWIPSCGAHNLVRADAETGAVEATISVSPADSEGGIAVGAGSVWLVTSAASELDRIDAATNAVIARITIPKGSFNPIFAGDSIWVASNEGNALVRVSPKTNTVVGSTPIGPKPRFLTQGEGSIWILNQGDGTVSRVDAESGKLLATIPAGIPGLGGEIAYGGGSVWATVFGFPITRIDPARNKVVQQWSGKGGDSIRYAHGSVWLTFLASGKVWRLQVPAA
jgi:DNA-binding beta-propeller fold protein YncE